MSQYDPNNTDPSAWPNTVRPGDPIPEGSVVGNSELWGVEHEFVPQPTAWESIPGAVRFAVWVWAISVIIGVVVGVAVGAAFMYGASR